MSKTNDGGRAGWQAMTRLIPAIALGLLLGWLTTHAIKAAVMVAQMETMK